VAGCAEAAAMRPLLAASEELLVVEMHVWEWHRLNWLLASTVVDSVA